MAKVLIAEHNQATSSYLAAALRKAGNNVVTVDNYLDAWRVSAQGSFDVLMVDVVMPGMDGFVLAQKALQENPLLQVIFITGFAGVTMDAQTTPSHAPSSLRPFHLKETAGVIRYLMGVGGLPAQSSPADSSSNVVYADFGSRAAVRHQASSLT